MRNRDGPIRRFFRTPKGLLIVILTLLVAIAAQHEGWRAIAPGISAAVLSAGLADILILRARGKSWEIPSGAVLTALIVAMVLRPQEPWRVTAAVALIAIASKYVFRSRISNVFNPAALAIIISFHLYHTGQNWWGALPEVAPAAQLALVITGVFITDRVNKAPLVLAFLSAYFLLFTVAAFAGDPGKVSEIYRAPDLQAVLFFAFIILTDPPTSPNKYRDQIVCGVLVAAAGFAVFEWSGAVYYLLAGALVGNVWEAWRRVTARTGRTFPAGVGFFLREISPWRARKRTLASTGDGPLQRRA